jgi:hypothetical protein
MGRKQAVCVSCGRFKRRALARCKHCGYLPDTDYEIARAVILSRQVRAGEAVMGRSLPELERISTQIRSGRPYLFDPNEEQTALYAHRHLQDLAAGKRRRHVALAIVLTAVILGVGYLALMSG